MDKFIKALRAADCVCLVAVVMTLQTGCIKKNAVAPPAVRPELLQLAITEINYHPVDDQGNNADQFEFVEIKDTGSTEVDLTDVQFNDGIDFEFPAQTILQPGKFYILASNTVEFKARYGFDPDGVFTGKLSNSGEKLSIQDKRAKVKFLSVTYGTGGAWPKSPDGDGNSLVTSGMGPSADPNSPIAWRASFRKNGSPRADDPGVVYVNELLAHTDPPDTDAVELYNPNNYQVDIGGWFLTDRKVDPAKFKFPAGTTVPAKGYFVITASSWSQDTVNRFSFSEHGEDVYLNSDSSGYKGNGYYHGFSFGENENGVSLGRVINSRGDEDFIALTSKTLGGPNTAPRVGPLVISEIMYHPKNGIDDYIELSNVSGSELALYYDKDPKNTWKIDGFNFVFPENITLKSDEKVVVISNKTTVAQFVSTYGIDPRVKVYQAAAALSNSGDFISILKPGDPYIDTTTAAKPTLNPSILVERIHYSDAKSWHGGADGTGLALQRVKLTDYGNDPINWTAAAASPGK